MRRSFVPQEMKAVRVHKFGGVDQLILEDDVAVPSCGKDKILVRIVAVGVNPVDTYIRQGAFHTLPKLPFVAGQDGAGVVEKIGEKVDKFKVGDRVYFTRSAEGTYAEFCTVAQINCWHLAKHLTFEQGASVGVPYFTAYRALFQKGNANENQTVLIHGASGAVGLAACQLAHSAGLTIYGTAGSDEGLKLVKMNGAHAVFNHRERGYIDEIAEAVKDQNGVDLIIEMLANVNLAHDFDLLARNGTVVIVGSRGQIKIDPRALMLKESKAVGVALFQSTAEEWQEITSKVSDGLNKKVLSPVVAKTYSLSQAFQAQKDIIEKVGTTGKLVLRVDT